MQRKLPTDISLEQILESNEYQDCPTGTDSSCFPLSEATALLELLDFDVSGKVEAWAKKAGKLHVSLAEGDPLVKKTVPLLEHAITVPSCKFDTFRYIFIASSEVLAQMNVEKLVIILEYLINVEAPNVIKVEMIESLFHIPFKTPIPIAQLAETIVEITISKNASLELVSLLQDSSPELLKVYRRKNEEGKCLLHTYFGQSYTPKPLSTLSIIIACYPKAIAETDKDGRLPVHYAIACHAAADEVSLLISNDPETAKVQIKFEGNNLSILEWAIINSSSLKVVDAIINGSPGDVLYMLNQ